MVITTTTTDEAEDKKEEEEADDVDNEPHGSVRGPQGHRVMPIRELCTECP